MKNSFMTSGSKSASSSRRVRKNASSLNNPNQFSLFDESEVWNLDAALLEAAEECSQFFGMHVEPCTRHYPEMSIFEVKGYDFDNEEYETFIAAYTKEDAISKGEKYFQRQGINIYFCLAYES